MSRALCVVFVVLVGLTLLWSSATEAFAYTTAGPARVEHGHASGVAQRFLASQMQHTVTSATEPVNRSLSLTLGGLVAATVLAAGVAVRRS
eukprot:CAMPEP_0117500276 /NCGR_PEP_ID=MMETSP0784-20121206/22693_1 /TAXON_ID=39447 /ORGANISM="" /LENGTH=90 /DNA_ID=CAMNT_0005295481 /DNA_START=69 /DNA_END=337 /DNA_ORIENTATION=-